MQRLTSLCWFQQQRRSVPILTLVLISPLVYSGRDVSLEAMARHIPLKHKSSSFSRHIEMAIKPDNNIPWRRINGLRYLQCFCTPGPSYAR